MTEDIKRLVEAERDLLQALAMRPNGMPIRDPDWKEAALALADRQLVCDPHHVGRGDLFTRITDAGRQALAPTLKEMDHGEG